MRTAQVSQWLVPAAAHDVFDHWMARLRRRGWSDRVISEMCKRSVGPRQNLSADGFRCNSGTLISFSCFDKLL